MSTHHAPALSRPTLFAMALAAGLAVANIYYNQPMLEVIGQNLHDPRASGWIPTVTQLGYAAGLLFLVPLGDMLERRRLIVAQFLVLALALVVAAIAPNLATLALASVLVGAAATVAQQIVPFAAILASPAKRGAAIGTVMSGLLTGILLSRTLSSLVSDIAGWRVVYLGSAALMAVLAVALRFALPQHAPTTTMPYHHVLRSTIALVRTHPALLRRGLYQAAMFGAFSAFWTTISYVLTGPRFHYSPVGVGIFALVGAAGAAIAPLAGHWADRKLVRPMTGLAFAVAAASFAVAGFGQHSIVLLALAAILIDMAVQTTLILGQHTIYQLDASARARLNSAFIATFFLGGALGSQLGSIAYRADGWGAVSILGAALPLLALLYWLTEHRAAEQETVPVSS